MLGTSLNIPKSFKLSFGLVYLFIALALLQCANPRAPIGGIKDEIPPQLNTEKSSPNYQTNFDSRSIELTFDEWLKLEDVFNQVVVSPPLQMPPEILLKGKTVTFNFDENEVLKPDATYTINFGEAIKDLTEGNAATDLRYVFSTGSFIDSLQVAGKVVDAFTNDPVKNVLVFLYDNLEDSVVRTELPFYFARTNEAGAFRIENVKSGKFKVFALDDSNLDYKFDQINERIAFSENFIEVNDSVQNFLSLRMFNEEIPLKILDKEVKNYGRLRLEMNNNPRLSQWTYDNVGQTIASEIINDSLVIWYHNTESKAWNLYITRDSTLNDTIEIPALSATKFLEQDSLHWSNTTKSSKGKSKSNVRTAIYQNPYSAFEMLFNHPLKNVDTSKIGVFADSLRIPTKAYISIDSINPRKLLVDVKWVEGTSYELELLPGAIVDIFNFENDSLDAPIRLYDPKTFGTIILKADSIPADYTTILQLIEGNNKLVKEFLLKDTGSFEEIIRGLKVGDYSIRIIQDMNDDGRWTTGYYDLKRQPEKVRLRTLEKLRANWDLEAIIEPSIFNTE